MSANVFTGAALALALTALGSGPPNSSPVSELARFHAIEGQTRRVLVLEGADQQRLPLTKVVEPSHGVAILNGPNLDYTPAAGYVGRDWLKVRIDLPGTVVYRRYDIVVLPRRMAFLADWSGGSLPQPGFYDLALKRFQQCNGDRFTEPGATSELPYPTLSCVEVGVPGAPSIAVPLILPGEPGQADQPALFAPETGLLYRLADAGGEWGVVDRQDLSIAAGRFPVVGRFAAGEPAGIAFVGDLGEVGFLSAGGGYTEWPTPVAVPGGDLLPWPLAWSQGTSDALALQEPAAGDLDWWSADGFTGNWGCLSPPGYADRAFAVTPWHYGGQILALTETADGTFVTKTNCGSQPIQTGSPQTYPVKFPDDPPGP